MAACLQRRHCQARSLTAESSVLTTAAAEARREGTPEWRRVLAVALDIEGSHATFAPGDAVAVRAENDPRDVAGLLSRLGLKGDRAVALSGVDGAPAPSHLPTPATVGELFTRNIDFTSPARKTVLAGLAGACGDAGEARTLRFMASRGGRDHYRVQVKGVMRETHCMLSFMSSSRGMG